jgi:hypothetical protein
MANISMKDDGFLKFRKFIMKTQYRMDFSSGDPSIDKLQCAFCSELPTDPRVTRCCRKNVCFKCWGYWKTDCTGRSNDTSVLTFSCRLCRRCSPWFPAERARRLESVICLVNVSEEDQQELNNAKIKFMNMKILAAQKQLSVCTICIYSSYSS